MFLILSAVETKQIVNFRFAEHFLAFKYHKIGIAETPNVLISESGIKSSIIRYLE